MCLPLLPVDAIDETPDVGFDEPAAPSSTPYDLDLRTTTDTEVRRLRTLLTSELLNEAVNHMRAETNLADRQLQHQQRRHDRQEALDAVEHLQQVSVHNAVSQFMNAQTGQDRPGLPAPTDHPAEATFSSHAIDQLGRERDTAAERLEQADQHVENAAHRVAQARARLVEARHALQAAQDRLTSFEHRADEHQRIAREADRRAAARSSKIDLRSVAGALIVNATIETDIDRLLADARLDGHDLSGGGFRTEEAQIRLRLAHCDLDHPPDDPHDPTDAAHIDYLVHLAPAESCSPPTAPPGRSEHQNGLAIDFTESGRLLTRSSPGYRWLVDNAHFYGLSNLPSEPWHWSTTGR